MADPIAAEGVGTPPTAGLSNPPKVAAMSNGFTSVTLLIDDVVQVGQYEVRAIRFRGESVRLLIERVADRSVIAAESLARRDGLEGFSAVTTPKLKLVEGSEQ